MAIFPKTRVVNHAEFQTTDDSRSARYGLPTTVTFCQRCVTSNQKPISAIEFQHTAASVKQAIHLDETNICDACRVTERKTSIDWQAREEQLRALCDKHRSTDGSYDCLVPGSGGKDSFVAAHMLKYKYGMHPLTVTWAPHVYTEWGWRNFQRWIHAGFDNYLCTPNGRVHRLLTRLAVENLFHPFQAFILGQKSLAPKMAVLHQIPLVFYGENEAEYGNPMGDADSAIRQWKYFSAPEKSSIHLGGTSIKDLTTDFGLEEVDLDPYLPANPDGLQKLGIEVHYLGYYMNGTRKVAITTQLSMVALRHHLSEHQARTASTTQSMIELTTFTTTQLSLNMALVEPHTMRPKKFDQEISTAKKVSRSCNALTANFQLASQKKYLHI